MSHRTIVEHHPLFGYHARCDSCEWIVTLRDGYQGHSEAAREHRLIHRRIDELEAFGMGHSVRATRQD